VIGAIRAANTV
jgi:hypothetical protein